jgi:hypothetical protein
MNKKTVLLITSALAASTTQAFYNSTGIFLNNVAERSSVAPSTLVNGSVNGNLTLQMETDGLTFYAGALTGYYQVAVNPPGGFGNHTVTYTNIYYDLGNSTGKVVDYNYQNSGDWLIEYRFGGGANVGDGSKYDPTRDINSWSTARQSPDSSLRNNSGAAAASYINGYNCVGNGCSTWGASSVGLEGLILQIAVNPNANFVFTQANLIMNEFTGSSFTNQTQIQGSGLGADPLCVYESGYEACSNSIGSIVPLPATAWLMGSGLLGLAGIARRKNPSQ